MTSTLSAPAPLRPLRLGQLLDQAIRLYRRNFWKFVGIVAIVLLPLTLVQKASSNVLSSLLEMLYRSELAQYPHGFTTLRMVDSILYLIKSTLVNLVGIQGLAMAAMAYAVTNEYLGISTSIVQAYRKVGGLRPVTGILVALLISLGLTMWFFVPIAGWLTGLGVLTYFFSAVVPLIAPTIVLERQPVWHSARRAWDLVRKRFWWVFGFVIALFAFERLFTVGPSFLLQYILTALFALDKIDSYTLSIIQGTIQSLVTLTLTLLCLPIRITSIVLMYLDLRVRTEGLDLIIQAEPPTEPEQVEHLLTQAPRISQDKIVAWSETGRFALLSLIVLVGFAALITLLILPFYLLNWFI